jgi:hypothetical protein
MSADQNSQIKQFLYKPRTMNILIEQQIIQHQYNLMKYEPISVIRFQCFRLKISSKMFQKKTESFKTNYDYTTATNMDDSNEIFCD